MKTEDSREIELVHDALQEPARIARYLRASGDGLEALELQPRAAQPTEPSLAEPCASCSTRWRKAGGRS